MTQWFFIYWFACAVIAFLRLRSIDVGQEYSHWRFVSAHVFAYVMLMFFSFAIIPLWLVKCVLAYFSGLFGGK
jgi:hypothetical protein